MALASKTFSNAVTFTRASSATYFDSTGALQTAASNVSRIDYNPSTLAVRGLLIEESRTNSIRNNTMVGAVAGTPGTLPTNWGTALVSGISVDVASTGTEAGISYIDLTVSGTAGATQNIFIAFETASTISALQNQTWTHCFYIKNSTTATLPNNIAIGMRTYNSSGGLISAIGAIATVATSSQSLATTRQSYSATLSGATVAYVRPTLEIPVTSGVTYNFTLRIGLPQLELGAFSTSVISTTSAAATRAADLALVNVNRWFYDTEGTLFAQTIKGFTGNFVNYPHTAGLSDGTSSNRIWAGYGVDASQHITPDIATGGSSQLTYTVGLYSMTSVKNAIAYKNNDSQWAFNGTTSATDTLCTIPSNLNKLNIGSDSVGGQCWNGWIRSIKYYPRRLTDAELITLTT